MTVPCTHWSDCGVSNGGCCGLGLLGGRPSIGACSKCQSFKPASKGLGDWFAQVTLKSGLMSLVSKVSEASGSDCGCDSKQKELNALK